MADSIDKPRKVPLVRAEGGPYDGTYVTPQQLAADPRLLPGFKTQRTRAAEAALGLGDSLYFYVGFACPDFGDMVFVYDPAVSFAWEGTATPFDTGGIIGYIHANGLPGEALAAEKRRAATPLTDEEGAMCLGYVQRHVCATLRDWQARFDAFVAAYYDGGAASYVRGERPKPHEETGRHRHEKNERRAWTWEIQSHREHNVFDGLWLLRMSFEKEQLLTAALEDRGRDDPWRRVLKDGDIFARCEAHDAKAVCADVEKVISSWV